MAPQITMAVRRVDSINRATQFKKKDACGVSCHPIPEKQLDSTGHPHGATPGALPLDLLLGLNARCLAIITDIACPLVGTDRSRQQNPYDEFRIEPGVSLRLDATQGLH